ncbi:hypothetical protein BX616_000617 [Lobosporangium transversale]|uniref:Uncharacterized protein n=1 Tax=Lobosporangium transversale TaxID=64571 RepID=A0A1Y2H1X2_9FUNG|nr:hypothetical protein BCR41DRAFT_392034 [Lobosporangium transversale]KAF9906835.1 hypothetical protein BX616_000617 [Lobosporangium transversale]ORZ28569.1 hypothetical protein BCR41DRAFT_392034 [Lobosporangium transversale]|eukprot:XP_021886254.1 hypothetical protein BCR41DRAFT_392034 [Lobosporangium transversale]
MHPTSSPYYLVPGFDLEAGTLQEPKSPSQTVFATSSSSSSSSSGSTNATFPSSRKSWAFLSLSVSIGVLVSTSVYLLFGPDIFQLPPRIQALDYQQQQQRRQQQQQQQQQQQTTIVGDTIWISNILSFPSWPRLPFERVINVEDEGFFSKEGAVTAPDPILKQGGNDAKTVIKGKDENSGPLSLGEIEILVAMTEDGEEFEQDNKPDAKRACNNNHNHNESDGGIYSDGYDGSGSDSDEDRDERDGLFKIETDLTDEILDDIKDITEKVMDQTSRILEPLMNTIKSLGISLEPPHPLKRPLVDEADTSIVGDNNGNNNAAALEVMSLVRHRKKQTIKSSSVDEGGNGNDNKKQKINDDGYEDNDPDKDDHFPLDMDDDTIDDDNDANDGNNNPNKNNKEKNTLNSNSDNNNLGSTGGNGPILLCSSETCLPSLRDAILSKLAVQIHHVMNHLRNRDLLIYMMASTAPQTKDKLIVAQEELVQDLENRIVKDLNDWVMGRNRRKGSRGKTPGTTPLKAATTSSSTSESEAELESGSGSGSGLDGGQNEARQVSADSVGAFLAGDNYDEEDEGDTQGFHIASLTYEDDDDDDEDHEDDIASFPQSGAGTTYSDKKSKQPKDNRKRKSKGKSTHRKRDIIHTPNASTTTPRKVFLSADKLLMRQEWSRWIAHWVHHTKILILSHTLATQTLNDMNQIVIQDENVPLADQRHWSWNLDKAIATVMMASEMLCGAPPTLLASKTGPNALPMLSMNKTDSNTAKIVALNLNAKRCIETWGDELDEILQRTATTD